MSHINGTESVKAEKPGGLQAIRQALSPKVTRFLNDPDYLLTTNTALLKLYTVLLLPLAAYHLAVGFGIAESWQKTGLSILAVGALRVTLWFLLLGPVYFMLFYIPSQLASMLLYTHFNYFTHLPDENGNYVPANCDNRGLIRILNALTFNAYYHKNHHDNPGAFNPKYVA